MENIKIHKVTLYRTFWRREWRWRVKATNGNIIASSSEGYKNKADAVYNMKSTACSLLKHFDINVKKLIHHKVTTEGLIVTDLEIDKIIDKALETRKLKVDVRIRKAIIKAFNNVSFKIKY